MATIGLMIPRPSTPDDFRIFCGDLGNEVNDDILARAFSRYPSFLKAKVIRDKRTGKTKGYGFVSFKDPNDYVRAMREMNGMFRGGTQGLGGAEGTSYMGAYRWHGGLVKLLHCGGWVAWLGSQLI